MHSITSLSDAVRIVHYHIAEKRGWEDTKKRQNMICWRDEKNGMIGPRRIWIIEYAKDVYRVKGGSNGPFIKSVWPYDVPNQERFELTLHASEITSSFVDELLPVVASSYNGFQEVPAINVFENAHGYPAYSWTVKAKSVYEARRKNTAK